MMPDFVTPPMILVIWALAGYLVQYRLSLRQKVASVPQFPALLQQSPVAGKFMLPMGEGLYWQD